MVERRVVPIKNYVILGIIIMVSILILYYFYMWIMAYKDSRNEVSVLSGYMTIINYNELDNYIVENPDSIIYVSKVGDSSIDEFEIKFKKKIDNLEIDNEFLYMDTTDVFNDRDVRDVAKDKYMFRYTDITEVPNIMVFKNGELMTIYNIKDNKYDVDKVVDFINSINLNDGVIYD